MNLIRILIKLKQKIVTIINCYNSGLGYNKTWLIEGRPIVRKGHLFSKNNNRQLIIGKKFTCYNNNKAELGSTVPCIFNLISNNCKIQIGNNVGVSSTVFNCRESILIGDNVKIGAGCLIMDNDSHPMNPYIRRTAKGAEGIITKPVIIEDDVFIGARSIILKGVSIGKCSIIGAGSVITKNIPPYSIVCGNPGKIIKSINYEENSSTTNRF